MVTSEIYSNTQNVLKLQKVKKSILVEKKSHVDDYMHNIESASLELSEQSSVRGSTGHT